MNMMLTSLKDVLRSTNFPRAGSLDLLVAAPDTPSQSPHLTGSK